MFFHHFPEDENVNRYQRHIQLAEVGAEGQAKLEAAKVLIVGAGGLGCPALQYLAAAGIGTIGIVDGDRVSLTNLQRQVLFDEKDIGLNKAERAKSKLEKFNSDIEIQSFPFHLGLENAEDILSKFDLVLDCTDNFVTRYLINDICVRINKPFVHGSLYKYEGQVSVFNYQNGPSYRCLFPNPPKAGDVPNCNEIGVLGVLPGIIGTIQATEAIKMILGLGEVLSGKLLHYDLLHHNQKILEFERNEELIAKIKESKNIELVDTDDCQLDVQISIEEITDLDKALLIDVRELDEFPRIEKANVSEIPLSQLTQMIGEIPSKGMKIFFCASGVRSNQALAVAKKENIPNCFSLLEGAEELENWIKK